MCRRLPLLNAGALLLAACTLQAAIPPGPAPKTFDATIRYRIDAFRNERIPQFRALESYLKAAGFQRDEDDVDLDEPADRRFSRMKGTVAAAKARLLLGEPHVETVFLLPAGAQLPADGQAVRIEIQLLGPLNYQKQAQLANEVRTFLRRLDFAEGVGYDTAGQTRLVGGMPFKNAKLLVDDVRLNPAAFSLLKTSLLADLRSAPKGYAALLAILDDWRETATGKKQVDSLISAWGRQAGGAVVLATQPANPTFADRQVTREKLLQSLVRDPNAAGVLTQFFEDAMKLPSAPQLMALVLRRTQGSTATADLPLMFRVPSAIRIVEVRPDLPLPSPLPPPVSVVPELMNVGEEMRALIEDKDAADKPLRFDVLLAQTPERGTAWRRALTSAGLTIDGRLGPLVSVVGTPAQAKEVARYDEVAAIRLPRPARPQTVEGLKPIAEDPIAFRSSGIARLWSLKKLGAGARIVVVDDDFRGWESQLGKGLAKATILIDLTRSRREDLLADPFAGDANQLGLGTLSALAVHKAAPLAEVTLIRVDSAAPYMVQAVASAINGNPNDLPNLIDRREHLDQARDSLRARLDRLLIERKAVFSTTEPDLEARRQNMKPDDPAVVRRKKYEDDQKTYDEDEREYQLRVRRFLKLQQDLIGLKGAQIVTSGLIWNEGYPVDGGSALSRWFDDRPFGASIWFQSAGDTRGQAWSGPFLDTDQNGVMEFSAPEVPLAKGQWSRELNFLAWQPTKGESTKELPADITVRLSVQWREPHEADILKSGEDAYREPLFMPRMFVFNQLDPDGKARPADDLEVVAQSSGLPQRLEMSANSAVYEQTVVLTVKKPGRYGIWIEGVVPRTIRPKNAPTLPTSPRFGELRVRLFAQTLHGAGRVILNDYVTDAGTIGMPGDALRVLTIGAADSKDQRAPFSAGGAPFGSDLAIKPDLLAFDQVGADGDRSTALASAVAAGIAACSLGKCASVVQWLSEMQLRPGSVVRVP